ncbi:peptidylprolyl isomerase [Maribacter sp. 2210JD10-5]|uniref:peptidylprolyl isomerase n=1 Tax=Maribacter sp. 2210JD10-5 TaxID=3386272 RepID=UPI0039BC6FDC
MINKLSVLVLTVLLFANCKTSQRADLGDGIFADIKTNKGDIIVKLTPGKTPVTVANFISLAEGENPFVSEKHKGKKYYDGLIFHRVMKDFMIQGGCPLGTGTGNPGYKFMDEFNDSLVHDKKGILSMANSGPDTNGSQFFITHKATPWLNNKHSVFGEVVEGIAVVDSIANIKVAAGNRPVDSVSMKTVEIIRNGKEAKKFDAVKIMTEYFDGEEERLAAIEKEKQEKLAALNKIKSDFAATIAKQKETAKTTPSGLKMTLLNKGSEEKPKVGQIINVDYAGYLEDGTMFDTSYSEVAENYGRLEEITRMHRGSLVPLNLTYSPDMPMIPGFKEAVLSLNIGDKARFFIPSHLGYGEQGSGPIPPNANLVFDIEITGVAE